MSGNLETLPTFIAAQVKHLLAHSSHLVEVDQIRSGCKNAVYSDRFTLLVPFCLDHSKWEIIYNAFYPSAAPDIIFSSEDEDFHPLPFLGDDAIGEITSRESSLHDWNSKDPSRLLSLIEEMRNLYCRHQRRRVEEIDDARLKFEISTVLSREGIEVCKIGGNDKTEVKFAIPLLDMDLNKLVPGCPWRKQQKIHLKVVFPVAAKYSSVPSSPQVKLVSSPDLKVLFNVDDVKLPPWSDGMCTAEYLPNLEEKLQEQIIEAVKTIDTRRSFIEALAPIFGNPLEADPVFCRSASVLAASGVFVFLVHFNIPVQFPKQQPILTLESSMHFDPQGRPVKSPSVMDYPWSPRWETAHMAERISEFLIDECLRFKMYCSEASSRLQ